MAYYAGDYAAGGYYHAGDNYAAGGLLSFAKKALSFTPLSAVSNLIPSFQKPPGDRDIATGKGGGKVVPTPGLKGILQRRLPGGKAGYEFSGGRTRRMNVTNVKALRRAGRRVKGFLRIARRLGALPVARSGKKLFRQPRRKK